MHAHTCIIYAKEQQTIKSSTFGPNPGFPPKKTTYRSLAGIIIFINERVDIWRALGISPLLKPRFFIGAAPCMPMCVSIDGSSWHGEEPYAPSRVYSHMCFSTVRQPCSYII